MSKSEWAVVERLALALKLHMNAVSHMQEAMKDGINVQGALSACIASEERASEALADASALRPPMGREVSVTVDRDKLKDLQTLISQEFGGYITWIDEALS